LTVIEPLPDTRTAAAFLHAVYRDVDHGHISLFSARGADTTVDWFTTSQTDQLADQAIAHSHTGRDVWFGVATRYEPLGARRGGADDCHQITALWLDVDVAGPRHRNNDLLPPTLDDAYAIVDRFEARPSLIVESGGGLQPWWLLDEPVPVDPEILRRWHITWSRLADELGGWRIDNVSDPARVMRVPGTLNHKIAGDPAEVVIAEATEIRYSLSDIVELLDDTPPPEIRPPAATTFDADDLRPGDEYNATHTGNHVLAAAGWHHHRQVPDGTLWRRPGKPDPRALHSAVVYNDGHTCCYSDTTADTKLDKHRSYDPWGLHVAINHAGDFAAAAKAWRTEHPKARPVEDWTFVGDPDDGSGAELEVPTSVDDANMAAAFGRIIDGRYLHCGQLGGWYRWDGRRWAHDHTEAVYETCRRWVLTLGAQMFRSGIDDEKIKQVTRYRTKAKIDAVVVLARRLRNIAANVDEFDKHPHLLCARNGTIDLRTGALAGHDPQLRITKIVDVDYQPDAHHPDVDAVLDVVTPAVRSWLQQLLGYAATGHVSEDLMPVLDGTGSNGKTTLLTAVSAALGEYAAPASAKLLMKSGHDEHPTLIADLHGRRLVYVEETAEGGALRTEAMKALTGGSELKARFMRADYFSFTPTHQLVVATNHRPAVNSTEHATWRRLRLVPFPHRYTRAEDARPGDRIVDRGLRARLRTGERQRAAMLAWIVAGAGAWHRDGIVDCPEITEATAEWRRSEDVILRFFEDRCELTPGASVRSSELHRAYAAWCEHEGRPSSSNKELTKRIEAHDVAVDLDLRKTRQGAVWFGLGVSDGL